MDNQCPFQNSGHTTVTLADLRDLVQQAAGLTPHQRSAQIGAINALGRACGQPLDSIPAEPDVIRPLLARITPAMAGVSVGRWRNIRSALGQALTLVHGVVLPRRLEVPLSDQWAELLRLIGPGVGPGFLLRRLARYASSQGVEPEAVTDSFLRGYHDAMRGNTLTSDPARILRDTARHWNAAAQRYANWPQRHLTVPDNRRRRTLAPAAFPASLNAEIERWLDHLGRDPLADHDFRPLRPSSIKGRAHHLRIYLSTLTEMGIDPATMTSLATVITPELARTALGRLLERAGGEPSSHLAQTAGTVVMLARHWVKLDDAGVRRIGGMARRLRPDQVGLTAKNERQMAELRDPQKLEAVLELPRVIMDMVRRCPKPGLTEARLMQAAVGIEILTMTAMRIGNLTRLSIGQTLLLRRSGGVAIVIPKEHVKNRMPIHADLPPQSARLIRLYIETYRPMLGSAGHGWLFAGQRSDGCMSVDGLRGSMMRALRNIAGVHITPHQFRHLFAQINLEADAGADERVTRALGHKRSDTTRRHYSGMQTRLALREHDKLVSRLRTGKAGTRSRRLR